MMNTGRFNGFTLVELVVVIAIAVILLGIGGLAVSSSLVRGRDSERKSDVENIATALNSAYATGYENISNLQGSYPSTSHMATENDIRNVFPRLGIENLKAPNAPDSVSLIIATNNSQDPASVTPQPSISQYIYQPLDSSDALCTSTGSECRKFNLFYRTEVDNTVQKIMSKYQ